MRAIWKGAVSFGLVSIGVKLYAATEEKTIRFHQVHRRDAGRIRYQRVCSVCGEQVSYDDIAKGYDLGGGELVVLTDEDFEDLPLATSRAIDVLEFVPADQIDPMFYNKAYYLEPEASATKPYLLLRDALGDSKRVAVVKVALRQREQLATLRVREGLLVLNTMLWPDEVRAPEFGFLDEEVETREPELAMAMSLIDSMTGDFHSDAYTDDYREALQQMIDAKVEGREVAAPEEPTEAPPAVDLMAALRASVERAQAARGGESSDEEADREPVEPTPISAARSRSGGARQGTKQASGKQAGTKQASGKQTSAEQGERKSPGSKQRNSRQSGGKADAGKRSGEKQRSTGESTEATPKKASRARKSA
ncbi:Ku protein [Natronosporangium hydrolyticum]|uniref:Non-homologous end joining protein Ku n=1 Tax=Natronosporangium hydrolyticum TaxID=2811111 RepID=A0A895YBU8_9ACTN|nr:Ku protein [Natronosporangium hydrolyticum]QSB15294.1 Ku protein [Natronosporangium hydrolyticum]